jgi:hypothetical protein
METILPDIEQGIPLPKNAADALPALTAHEELAMHARTIKLLADINNTPLEVNHAHIAEAGKLGREMTLNPKQKMDLAKYPNETVAYLAGMVQNMNYQLVDELAELKNYVINKLVIEVEEAKDPRVRVAALTKLGEIDGVDAFKRRSEITHVIKPIEEVEKELLTVLEGIEVRVLSQVDAPINS